MDPKNRIGEPTIHVPSLDTGDTQLQPQSPSDTVKPQTNRGETRIPQTPISKRDIAQPAQKPTLEKPKVGATPAALEQAEKAKAFDDMMPLLKIVLRNPGDKVTVEFAMAMVQALKDNDYLYNEIKASQEQKVHTSEKPTKALQETVSSDQPLITGSSTNIETDDGDFDKESGISSADSLDTSINDLGETDFSDTELFPDDGTKISDEAPTNPEYLEYCSKWDFDKNIMTGDTSSSLFARKKDRQADRVSSLKADVENAIKEPSTEQLALAIKKAQFIINNATGKFFEQAFWDKLSEEINQLQSLLKPKKQEQHPLENTADSQASENDTPLSKGSSSIETDSAIKLEELSGEMESSTDTVGLDFDSHKIESPPTTLQNKQKSRRQALQKRIEIALMNSSTAEAQAKLAQAQSIIDKAGTDTYADDFFKSLCTQIEQLLPSKDEIQEISEHHSSETADSKLPSMETPALTNNDSTEQQAPNPALSPATISNNTQEKGRSEEYTKAMAVLTNPIPFSMNVYDELKKQGAVAQAYQKALTETLSLFKKDKIPDKVITLRDEANEVFNKLSGSLYKGGDTTCKDFAEATLDKIVSHLNEESQKKAKEAISEALNPNKEQPNQTEQKNIPPTEKSAPVTPEVQESLEQADASLEKKSKSTVRTKKQPLKTKTASVPQSMTEKKLIEIRNKINSANDPKGKDKTSYSDKEIRETFTGPLAVAKSSLKLKANIKDDAALLKDLTALENILKKSFEVYKKDHTAEGMDAILSAAADLADKIESTYQIKNPQPAIEETKNDVTEEADTSHSSPDTTSKEKKQPAKPKAAPAPASITEKKLTEIRGNIKTANAPKSKDKTSYSDKEIRETFTGPLAVAKSSLKLKANIKDDAVLLKDLTALENILKKSFEAYKKDHTAEGMDTILSAAADLADKIESTYQIKNPQPAIEETKNDVTEEADTSHSSPDTTSKEKKQPAKPKAAPAPASITEKKLTEIRGNIKTANAPKSKDKTSYSDKEIRETFTGPLAVAKSSLKLKANIKDDAVLLKDLTALENILKKSFEAYKKDHTAEGMDTILSAAADLADKIESTYQIKNPQPAIEETKNDVTEEADTSHSSPDTTSKEKKQPAKPKAAAAPASITEKKLTEIRGNIKTANAPKSKDKTSYSDKEIRETFTGPLAVAKSSLKLKANIKDDAVLLKDLTALENILKKSFEAYKKDHTAEGMDTILSAAADLADKIESTYQIKNPQPAIEETKNDVTEEADTSHSSPDTTSKEKKQPAKPKAAAAPASITEKKLTEIRGNIKTANAPKSKDKTSYSDKEIRETFTGPLAVAKSSLKLKANVKDDAALLKDLTALENILKKSFEAYKKDHTAEGMDTILSAATELADKIESTYQIKNPQPAIEETKNDVTKEADTSHSSPDTTSKAKKQPAKPKAAAAPASITEKKLTEIRGNIKTANAPKSKDKTSYSDKEIRETFTGPLAVAKSSLKLKANVKDDAALLKDLTALENILKKSFEEYKKDRTVEGMNDILASANTLADKIESTYQKKNPTPTTVTSEAETTEHLPQNPIKRTNSSNSNVRSNQPEKHAAKKSPGNVKKNKSTSKPRENQKSVPTSESKSSYYTPTLEECLKDRKTVGIKETSTLIPGISRVFTTKLKEAKSIITADTYSKLTTELSEHFKTSKAIREEIENNITKNKGPVNISSSSLKQFKQLADGLKVFEDKLNRAIHSAQKQKEKAAAAKEAPKKQENIEQKPTAPKKEVKEPANNRTSPSVQRVKVANRKPAAGNKTQVSKPVTKDKKLEQFKKTEARYDALKKEIIALEKQVKERKSKMAEGPDKTTLQDSMRILKEESLKARNSLSTKNNKKLENKIEELKKQLNKK